jgi:integrase
MAQPKVSPTRSHRVLPIAHSTGETLPTLVRRSDWIPARVATRWVVRRRRFECMPSTLGHDLRALALLYEWAETRLGSDLDEMLERFEIPAGGQLDSLITFLRMRGNCSAENGSSVNGLPTVAHQAASIRSFLSWAVDPANQGSAIRKSYGEIADTQAMLVEVFRILTHYSGTAQRILPLSSTDLGKIDVLVGPVRDPSGRFELPLSFSDCNPFRPASRVRNWLMYVVAVQCGLRRGELLKIRLDDVPRPSDPGLKIRRRPHDPADVRRYRPGVKTVERGVPVSEEVRIGLRTYLSSTPPTGRPAGRSPYLFVSRRGAPLSITSADGLARVMGKRSGVPDLSWHSFRHTWAESLADDLLGQYPEEQALAYIRELGGWKSNSTTPLYYIQNAMAKRACEFLRLRNNRLYQNSVEQA